MKRFDHLTKLFITMLCFSPFCSWGQISRGSKFIGGSISYYSYSTPPTGTYNHTDYFTLLNISPMVGFFLTDNFALGLGLGYGNQFSESASDLGTSSDKSTTLSAGIVARRYVNISEKFWFSINGSLSYRRETEESINTGAISRNPVNTLSIDIRPEFSFFPSSHWGVTAGIGTLNYSHSAEVDTDNASNTFALYAGSLSLGLQYFF